MDLKNLYTLNNIILSVAYIVAMTSAFSLVLSSSISDLIVNIFLVIVNFKIVFALIDSERELWTQHFKNNE